MSTCTADNDYDGRMGVRISAIFVIGVCSLFGKSAIDKRSKHGILIFMISNLVPRLRC